MIQYVKEWTEVNNEIRNKNINFIFVRTPYFMKCIELLYDKIFNTIHDHNESKRVTLLILNKNH